MVNTHTEPYYVRRLIDHQNFENITVSIGFPFLFQAAPDHTLELIQRRKKEIISLVLRQEIVTRYVHLAPTCQYDQSTASAVMLVK